MPVKRSPQVRVTLSDDLLNHLRKTAQAQHVSLRWLLPVWSVTLWKPGLNITRKITFSSRNEKGRMQKSLG